MTLAELPSRPKQEMARPERSFRWCCGASFAGCSSKSSKFDIEGREIREREISISILSYLLDKRDKIDKIESYILDKIEIREREREARQLST